MKVKTSVSFFISFSALNEKIRAAFESLKRAESFRILYLLQYASPAFNLLVKGTNTGKPDALIFRIRIGHRYWLKFHLLLSFAWRYAMCEVSFCSRRLGNLNSTQLLQFLLNASWLEFASARRRTTLILLKVPDGFQILWNSNFAALHFITAIATPLQPGKLSRCDFYWCGIDFLTSSQVFSHARIFDNPSQSLSAARGIWPSPSGRQQPIHWSSCATFHFFRYYMLRREIQLSSFIFDQSQCCRLLSRGERGRTLNHDLLRYCFAGSDRLRWLVHARRWTACNMHAMTPWRRRRCWSSRGAAVISALSQPTKSHSHATNPSISPRSFDGHFFSDGCEKHPKLMTPWPTTQNLAKCSFSNLVTQILFEIIKSYRCNQHEAQKATNPRVPDSPTKKKTHWTTPRGRFWYLHHQTLLNHLYYVRFTYLQSKPHWFCS